MSAEEIPAPDVAETARRRSFELGRFRSATGKWETDSGDLLREALLARCDDIRSEAPYGSGGSTAMPEWEDLEAGTRAIVGLHGPLEGDDWCSLCKSTLPCLTLRHLGEIFGIEVRRRD